MVVIQPEQFQRGLQSLRFVRSFDNANILSFVRKFDDLSLTLTLSLTHDAYIALSSLYSFLGSTARSQPHTLLLFEPISRIAWQQQIAVAEFAACRFTGFGFAFGRAAAERFNAAKMIHNSLQPNSLTPTLQFRDGVVYVTNCRRYRVAQSRRRYRFSAAQGRELQPLCYIRNIYPFSSGLAPAEAGCASMCEKCNQINVNLIRYRRLIDGINDKPVIENLGNLITALEAEKKSLHPESKKWAELST